MRRLVETHSDTSRSVPGDSASVDAGVVFEVASFLYREAQLLDDRRFGEWLDLFADDGVYLVPTDPDVVDPENHLNIAYEDRVALEDRVARLESGFAHAQDPPSRTARAVTNVLVSTAPDESLSVRAVVTTAEARLGLVTSFSARATYLLARAEDGQLRIKLRRLDLVNAGDAHGNITFVL